MLMWLLMLATVASMDRPFLPLSVNACPWRPFDYSGTEEACSYRRRR
jgi:hypothetical protein